MLKGLREFLFRGNVVDLAVAVVIGAAFGAVVTSLVANVVTPGIAAIAKAPDFSDWVLVVGESSIKYGEFLNALIAFLMIGASIYFLVVAPMNAYMERKRRGEAPAAPSMKKCPECLSEIPIAARRCAHCASLVEAAASA